MAGAVLRLLFVVAWRPAFMGWPDAASYIGVSSGNLFGNELRPAGYPMFLFLFHGLAPSLTVVIVVQHLLGLATATLLYLAVLRTGAPRLAALLPAGVVALGGDQIFLEHSPISESLFMFLIALGVYSGVRALEGAPRWGLSCGAALALAASVRVVALPLLPLVGIALLCARSVPIRRRVAVAVVAAAGVLLVLGPYYATEQSAVGKTGLSRNGIWNLYGRVAPLANCSKFTPPPGTAPLCENTPRADRPLTFQYTFNWYYSPAVRFFGNPHTATSAQTRQVASFAWAVILHQPLDYAKEVGASLVRYIAPESSKGYGGGPSYHDLVHDNILFNRFFQQEGRKVAADHYDDAGRFRVHRRLLGVLRTYEAGTRLQGPAFVLLFLLSIAGLVLARGRARESALLFVCVGWGLMVVPVATVEFSARTAVPGFGSLAAAAAVGGWRCVVVFQARRRRQQAGATTTEPPRAGLSAA